MAYIKPYSFKNLTIKSCTESDAHLLADYNHAVASEHSFMNRYPGQLSPDLEKVKNRWKEGEETPTSLFLGVFDQDKLVGLIFFQVNLPNHPWSGHVGRFGLGILKDYWGQGLAQELMRMMEQHALSQSITRIEAEVRAHNHRGIDFYLKNGYQIEGVRRQAAFIDGRYIDEYFIAKLITKD